MISESHSNLEVVSHSNVGCILMEGYYPEPRHCEVGLSSLNIKDTYVENSCICWLIFTPVGVSLSIICDQFEKNCIGHQTKKWRALAKTNTKRRRCEFLSEVTTTVALSRPLDCALHRSF